MRYTVKQIRAMQRNGDITAEQAKDKIAKIVSHRKVQQPEPEIAATVKLIDEVRSLATQFQKASNSQQNTSAAVTKFIPLLVEAIAAIKNIKIEPIKQNNKNDWSEIEVHFERDRNFLQKSPIILKRKTNG